MLRRWHPLSSWHDWQWRDVRSGKLTYGQEMVRRQNSSGWRLRYWISDKLVLIAEHISDRHYEET
jgi:hypothetical protein